MGDRHRDLRGGAGKQVSTPGRAVGAEMRATTAVGGGAGHHRGVGGRQGRGGAVHHVRDDAGDVVRAATPDGQLHQLQHDLVEVGHRASVLWRVSSLTTPDSPSEHSR